MTFCNSGGWVVTGERPYFTLWNAVTGEFDSDWHSTLDAAEAHRERCQLPDGWRVAQLSRDQRAQIYAQ